MTKYISRRTVLAGAIGGIAVNVPLPLLDKFLNNNGNAFASGAPLPVRFGTWFWGCGINPTIWTPKETGANFTLPMELQPLEPIKKHLNVFTGYRVFTDGRPNLCHYTGWVGVRCGAAPVKQAALPGQTIDVTVADAIGFGTRFRSIDVSAMGSARHTYSARSETAYNPPELTPAALYTRIFGDGFQDPNAAEFRPDPNVLARQSVLSAVTEQSKDFTKTLGQSDKLRMDEYFTSIRQLEQQLEIQLQKPPPAEACLVPGPAGAQPTQVGVSDIEEVRGRHKLMAQLVAMAVACNQTKIFNVVYSDSASSLSIKGTASTQHSATHEELVDQKLGYQPQNHVYVDNSMKAWLDFVQALASIKEGDGTLLDRTLVFAHSDQEFAKIHSIEGIPMMTAGTGGGRIKTGMHFSEPGQPTSKLCLSLLQALKLPVGEYGRDSMRTTSIVDGLLV